MAGVTGFSLSFTMELNNRPTLVEIKTYICILRIIIIKYEKYTMSHSVNEG